MPTAPETLPIPAQETRDVGDPGSNLNSLQPEPEPERKVESEPKAEPKAELESEPIGKPEPVPKLVLKNESGSGPDPDFSPSRNSTSFAPASNVPATSPLLCFGEVRHQPHAVLEGGHNLRSFKLELWLKVNANRFSRDHGHSARFHNRIMYISRRPLAHVIAQNLMSIGTTDAGWSQVVQARPMSNGTESSATTERYDLATTSGLA